MTWNVHLATRMRETGMTFAQIGAVFSLSPDTVHTRIDPDYRAKRRVQKMEKHRSHLIQGARASRVFNDDLTDRLAEIPDDNRGFTARAFGDPIFARSAAAQVKEEQPTANKITLPRVSILGERP
jgi:hypothetical protein